MVFIKVKTIMQNSQNFLEYKATHNDPFLRSPIESIVSSILDQNQGSFEDASIARAREYTWRSGHVGKNFL